MNLYLAAVYTNGFRKGQSTYPKLNEREAEIVDTIPNILESYHYVNRQKYVDEMRADGAQVFLDSGAFSAWNMGATISLPGYCKYIQENEDIIRKDDGVIMASVLDGIGDPLQTWRNQNEMEARGVTPLPCFHFGEDERYLEYYMSKYPYIHSEVWSERPLSNLSHGLIEFGKDTSLTGQGALKPNFTPSGSPLSVLWSDILGIASIHHPGFNSELMAQCLSPTGYLIVFQKKPEPYTKLADTYSLLTHLKGLI